MFNNDGDGGNDGRGCDDDDNDDYVWDQRHVWEAGSGTLGVWLICCLRHMSEDDAGASPRLRHHHHCCHQHRCHYHHWVSQLVRDKGRQWSDLGWIKLQFPEYNLIKKPQTLRCKTTHLVISVFLMPVVFLFPVMGIWYFSWWEQPPAGRLKQGMDYSVESGGVTPGRPHTYTKNTHTWTKWYRKNYTKLYLPTLGANDIVRNIHTWWQGYFEKYSHLEPKIS